MAGFFSPSNCTRVAVEALRMPPMLANPDWQTFRALARKVLALFDATAT